jgi:hypothetical protein
VEASAKDAKRTEGGALGARMPGEVVEGRVEDWEEGRADGDTAGRVGYRMRTRPCCGREGTGDERVKSEMDATRGSSG